MKKTIKILLALIVFLYIPYAFLFSVTVETSSICRFCLQHATTSQLTIPPFTFPRSYVFHQFSGGIMSTSGFSPKIPQVGSEAFSTLTNHPCFHDFVPGGETRIYGLIQLSHGHRRHREWELFQYENDVVLELFRSWPFFKDSFIGRQIHSKIVYRGFNCFDQYATPTADFFKPISTKETELISLSNQLSKLVPDARNEIRRIIILAALKERILNSKSKNEFQRMIDDFE